MTTKFFRKNAFPSPWGRVREGLAFLFLLLWPFVLSAQNGVTVSGLVMDAGTVTFEVSWKNTDMPTPWSDTVWVFVDYNDAGKMKRLPLITSGATLTATSAPGSATVLQYSDNDKGVWVVGNARSAGYFSATVQLYTATSTATGACVYASNYPPMGEYTSVTDISFTGTPMYEIVLKEISGGATSTAYSNGVYSIPEGSAFVSFTDATGAPGTFHCVPPAAPVVAKGVLCYEQSGELVAVVSGGATVVWYDAPAEGNVLYTGDVLSLQPLYNAAAQYYVQAVDGKCRSVRVKAEYTVNNCAISGDCPGYTAGNVGSNTTPAACATHYAGQIGAAAISSSCMAHDAGRIGSGAVLCEPPTAPTELAASTLVAYVGQRVTLTAKGGSNGTGAQYEWGSGDSAGSGVKTTGNTYHVSPVTTTTTYWVRRVSWANCGEPTAVATVTVETDSYHPDYPESEVCADYVIGAIGASEVSDGTATACAVHYAGRIGSAVVSSSCMAHDAGRIGSSN
jgi:hypothetical protein